MEIFLFENIVLLSLGPQSPSHNGKRIISIDKCTLVVAHYSIFYAII